MDIKFYQRPEIQDLVSSWYPGMEYLDRKTGDVRVLPYGYMKNFYHYVWPTSMNAIAIPRESDVLERLIEQSDNRHGYKYFVCWAMDQFGDCSKSLLDALVRLYMHIAHGLSWSEEEGEWK